MRTTIDRGGRVVVPKEIRERLGLSPGSEISIEEHEGVVEIRPAGRVVLMDRAEGRPVLRAPDAPRLTVTEVRPRDGVCAAVIRPRSAQ